MNFLYSMGYDKGNQVVFKNEYEAVNHLCDMRIHLWGFVFLI